MSEPPKELPKKRGGRAVSEELPEKKMPGQKGASKKKVVAKKDKNANVVSSAAGGRRKRRKNRDYDSYATYIVSYIFDFNLTSFTTF
jgi:hypothetical protein